MDETLDAHIAKRFNTDAAHDRCLKTLLTYSLIMSSIATFVRCKTDPAIEEQIKVFAKALKKEPVEPLKHMEMLSKISKFDEPRGARSPS